VFSPRKTSPALAKSRQIFGFSQSFPTLAIIF
jgi:hypothetical protein